MQFPPTSYFALLKAEASDYALVSQFLTFAANAARHLTQEVTIYDAVRPQMERLKNMERAHLMLQAPTRQALQRLLKIWMPQIRAEKLSNKVRWALDIDPLEF